jgi:hypothetical protein
MITLTDGLVTTIKYLAGANEIGSQTTDTLFISEVRIDFGTGAIYATIKRGYVDKEVFRENYPALSIVVNPDGSFISNDGKYTGTVPISQLVQGLSAQFDSFVGMIVK